MYWANFFHIYQPPNWEPHIIRKVTKESYRPLMQILRRHPQLNITLNVSGSLTEQLAHLKYNDVIRDIRSLTKRGQIELVGTALYHPILPKLPAREIQRQITLNERINRKLIGSTYRPHGLFMPEMAYGHAVAKISKKLGYRWLILDEISRNGTFGDTQFDARYVHSITGQSVVYRNKFMSDFLAFRAPLKRPGAFWEELKKINRSAEFLITGMDGEGLGHHRPGAEKLWEQLVTDKRIVPLTISQLLKTYTNTRHTTPRRSSWSSRPSELKKHLPYMLWDDKENPIHQLQWHLVKRTIALVDMSKKNSRYTEARALLDKRLASDQFWWASAKPWWSKEIVDKKTDELVDIVALLQPKQRWATSLADRIKRLTTDWQRTGHYKQTSKRYLKTSPYEYVHYIGGKRIST